MATAAIAAVKATAAWLAKKGLAQAIVKLGLQLAATAVVSKLTSRTPGRNQGLLMQTDLSAQSPRRVQVGKRLNGGVFVDWLTKGNINEDTWRIFYLGEGPMGNVTKIFADGRVVFNGTLTHGSEVTLTALDSRVRVRYYDGRPGQTADANLLASGVGWTANHVGTGCAYCVVYARFHDTKLVVPPDMSFEVEGAKLYDRRQDSTAGGSGSQRLKDPSTWALSTNPAVALDHYLLGRFLSSGDDEPWFGVGLDPALVPYADFAAMANLCDEQVSLKVSGTQDRYAMNGFIFADEVFRDVIRRICDHMNARPADFGGLISVIDGESKVPVLTLDKADAIEESAEVYKPKAPYSQIVGGVEGRYQDPANNYQPTDYPRYTEAAWKTEDGGETKFVTRDFDYETNQERAERLASLYAKRARRQATLTGVYPISALVLEEGDWFTRTGGKFGTGKVFEVVGSPVLDVETMTVAVQSIEVDPTDSAWDETQAADQADAPDADPSGPALPFPDVTVTALDITSGGVEIPALRFKHNDYDQDPPIVIEVEVAENDGSNGPEGDRFTMFMTREQHYGVMTGLLPSDDYVARWKGQIGELESAWSNWTPVTTTSGYTVGSAASVPWSGVQDDGNRPDDNANVTGDHIAAGITDQSEWATYSIAVQNFLESLSGGNEALSENPYLADPSYSGGVPPGFTDWAGGATLTRGTFYNRPVVDGDARSAAITGLGLYQWVNDLEPGQKVKARIVWRRTGGTYEASGMHVTLRNSGGNLQTVNIDCENEVPVGKSAVSTTHDGITIWEKVITMPAGSDRILFYPMWKWSGFGAPAEGNGLQASLLEASITPLTEAERRTDTQEDNADPTGTNIAAGIDQQGDLATRDDVDTAQIAGNAVTNTQVDQDDTATSPTNETWTDVASVSFTSVGIGVQLRGSCEIDVFSDGATPTAQVRLVRDSTTLKTSKVFLGTDAGSGFQRIEQNISLDYNDLPSSGTYDYKLQARLSEGTGAVVISSFDVENRFISAIEYKR